jgi:cysteine-rich repeat protein
VGNLCVLDFGARDVQLTGTLDAQVQSGSFTIMARDLTLNGGRLRSPGDADETGGPITVSLTGAFTMQGAGALINTGGTGGGGDVTVTATSLNLTAGVIDAAGGSGEDCGDGASVTLVSTGVVTIAVPISADTPGIDCDGGDIDITGTAVTISQVLDCGGGDPTGITIDATAGALSVTSTGGLVAEGRGNDEGSGGGGADVDLSATGNISIAGEVRSTGSADGDGGDIILDAGGSVTVSDRILVNGGGSGDAFGGGIEILAEGPITVGAALEAKTGGAAGAGGDIALETEDDITVTATGKLDARGPSGTVAIFGSADTTVAGVLDARVAGGGMPGSIDVEGCHVDLTGSLDTSATGGGNAGAIKAVGGTITVGATASVQALPCPAGPSCITFTVRSGAPLIQPGAVIDPPHQPVVNPSLAICCGNGVTDAGESCDDGNTLGCDGCSRLCVTEASPPCPPDGNQCTSDCHPTLGCVLQPLTGTPCAGDGNACTNDVCFAGSCTHPALTCDDAIACTTNACDSVTGCVFTPDDDACDDADSCTTDACSATTGCTYVSQPDDTPCNDGDVCTTSDLCQGGNCTPKGTPLNCDDGSPCTTDVCHPAVACIHFEDAGQCPCSVGGNPLPPGTPCADGNSCTEGDTCDGAGTCTAGPFCDDADACTTDGCYLGVCVHSDDACTTDCSGQPDGAPCSDGSACTTQTCQDGACASQPLVCGDGDPCTGAEFCVEALGCRDSEPPIDDPLCRPLDHFTCYVAKTSSGAAAFTRIPSLPVEDEFGAGNMAVKKIYDLCTPTDKNGEDPGAPGHEDHLMGYQIRAIAGSPPFVRRTNIEVTNQFGTIRVDTISPDRLLVPTAKSPTAPPALPVPPDPDHFKCYRAKLSSGSAVAPVDGLSIEDQFGTLTVDLKKPTRLCSPANKNGEDPDAPTHPEHLLCYKARRAPGTDGFVKQPNLFIANQLQASSQVNAVRLSDICVPSIIAVP